MTLTFVNSEGNSLIMGDRFPYVLESHEGLSSNDIIPQTSKGYGQHGQYYHGTLEDMRLINLTVKFNCTSPTQGKERQRQIVNVLNPRLGLGTLIYEDIKTDTKLKANAFISLKPVIYRVDNTYSVKAFDVAFTCPKPDWLSYDSISLKAVGLTGGLQYPKRYPIRYATSADNVVIDYDGDNPANVLFEFRVKDGGTTAVNPKILDLNGNYIEIDKTLLAGEKILVDTNPDAPSITFVDIDGNEEDAWDNIVHGSRITLFQLYPGENEYAFSATSGDPELYIEYNIHYGGVK